MTLVLLSGGFSSLVCVGQALGAGRSLETLTFDDDATPAAEIERAATVARAWSLEHETIDLSSLSLRPSSRLVAFAALAAAARRPAELVVGGDVDAAIVARLSALLGCEVRAPMAGYSAAETRRLASRLGLG